MGRTGERWKARLEAGRADMVAPVFPRADGGRVRGTAGGKVRGAGGVHWRGELRLRLAAAALAFAVLAGLGLGLNTPWGQESLVEVETAFFVESLGPRTWTAESLVLGEGLSGSAMGDLDAWLEL